MIKKVNKLGKRLFYLDTSKIANCRKLPLEIREMMMKINKELYDFNFELLDEFWRSHVLYKPTGKGQRPNRRIFTVEHFKDNAYWKQLQAVEHYLYIESLRLRLDKEAEPCLNCPHYHQYWDGLCNRFQINEKECDKSVANGTCPNLVELKKGRKSP
jgi:hypothetical protein